MKVGVVGASGYVGGETLRLLVNHPAVAITTVTSRQHVGEYLHRVQPSLKGFTDLTFSELAESLKALVAIISYISILFFKK